MWMHEPFREFDRLATDLLRGGTSRSVPMDAYRRGDEIFVHLDLPGVDPGSIDLTVERNVLNVTARRAFDRSEIDQVILAERPQGVFQRQIFLGDGLDIDELQADYDGGVLLLRIPVHEAARPRRIPIAVGDGSRQAIEAEDRVDASA